MIARLATLLLGLAMATGAFGATTSFHIIPKPQHLQAGTGHFTLDADTAVVAPDDARAQGIADFLRRTVDKQTGIALGKAGAGSNARITLKIDPSIDGDEAIT